MYRVIQTYEFSYLTNGLTRIIVPYISDVNSSNYQMYDGLHFGVDIELQDVCSLTLGVVIEIFTDTDTTYSVVIQYDKDNVFRYSNIQEVDVNLGDIVYAGQHVGQCDGYCHFEYATSQIGNSTQELYVNTEVYYKQDPNVVLSGQVTFNNSPTIEVESQEDPNIQTIF